MAPDCVMEGDAVGSRGKNGVRLTVLALPEIGIDLLTGLDVEAALDADRSAFGKFSATSGAAAFSWGGGRLLGL